MLRICVPGWYHPRLTADQGQVPALGSAESRGAPPGHRSATISSVAAGCRCLPTCVATVEVDALDRTQGYAIYATATLPLSPLVKPH